MPVSGDGDGRRLDPVVEEALKRLRSFTYRRRRLISTAKPSQRRARSPFTRPTALDVVRHVAHLRPEERDKSLNDPGARSGAVHIFKHLKHHGYSWEPEDIHAWAIANGFTAQDSQQRRMHQHRRHGCWSFPADQGRGVLFPTQPQMRESDQVTLCRAWVS